MVLDGIEKSKDINSIGTTSLLAAIISIFMFEIELHYLAY